MTRDRKYDKTRLIRGLPLEKWMMSPDTKEWRNRLYLGDNLPILRERVPDETVDLIYLDPPFNSQATYNVLFAEKNGAQSSAQITAFEDTWHGGADPETHSTPRRV